MTSAGARHIVLSSRTPKEDEPWVEDHAANGVCIAYLKADITDKYSLRAAYEKIRATMPPVAGVANGTLILKDRGLASMDLETFHANTKCKVEGTENLDEMFPRNTLDWFIASRPSPPRWEIWARWPIRRPTCS